MTALVVVSHSAPLAEAAVAAARAMTPQGEVAVEVAAGAPDGALGTDASAVACAIERLAQNDDVLVLTDVGSSVMAAETALELLPPELRDRVFISPGPLVEGLFAAMPMAALGAGVEEVAAEAAGIKAPPPPATFAPGAPPSSMPAPGAPPSTFAPAPVASPSSSPRPAPATTPASGSPPPAPGASPSSAPALGNPPSALALPASGSPPPAPGAPSSAPGGASSVPGASPSSAVSGGSAAGGAAAVVGGAPSLLSGDDAEEDTPPTGPAPAAGGTMRVSFTLTNTHGLHARPAALLVAQVRTFDSNVRARNVSTGSEWIDAASVTQVTTLGACRGHVLELEASGPEAQRALNAVVDLVKENFGEGDAPAPGEGAGLPMGSTPPLRLDQRLPASPGYAIGPLVHLVGGELDVPESDELSQAKRWDALMAAFEAARVELRAAKAQSALIGGPTEAAIFDAHLLMLEDRSLLQDIRERIEAGQGVAHAWSMTMTTLAVRISKLDDAYLRSRASDAKGLRDQVLRHLLGAPRAQVSGEGILVVADLSPTEAAALEPDVTRGVVLTAGSPTSHAAIVARSLGVPMITGAGRSFLALPLGTVLAIDGGTGRIEVDPPAQTVAEFERRIEQRASVLHSARRRARRPAITQDGIEIPVLANVGSFADAEAALAAGADGSGLVRTEFLFADRPQAPSRAEQEEAYRAIAEAFDGRRVVIRTLDAGGDKPMEYLRPPLEANPFLGVRGLRLELRHPQLLLDQLSAICAVAEDHPVSVMFPMVADVTELIQARRALAQAARERGRPVPPQLRVGIMVEVPAAALKAAAFAPLVDFFSIGSNDLTQYAMAAERGNAALAPLADALDPAMLRLIGTLCRGARDRASVSICGEMASDPDAIPFLLGLGVTSLSVPPPAIAEVKDRVRQVRVSAARPLAGKAQRARDAIAVRAMVAPAPAE